ncbi:MAG TPA: multifunctional oxoglutarate decarboxylase/oxoglutarate dehydrogenase thiamine pyrophosphate-binding subunit/dihydrolipoyllysine-residue succinyltransferase subunit, partial [Acidimicrobiales bacterium]|nr:multifunctional oxoglutarate decarboxylase/oxoglutarate dehydrogenase thiamine pyrophosphate-binding subunit/dihydrolipoyllysine-residue succinyltransferase subunit [Acidimicrobiales bacterium]
TSVDQAVLDRVAAALHTLPEGFHPHPKLAKQLAARAEMYASGEVDWAMAEALAFGSLMLEGIDVRLAGQDSRRGTFSQRHAVLVDYENEQEYQPLSSLSGSKAEGGGRVGRFLIYDSLLSEYAALGFEYGYSVARPDALVIWEAQFGDFVNVGQVVIDQFIAAAEDKWGQTSGLVLMLPHGYEGQGPEHSSARVERFLTLCAEGNMTVANCTTAAQGFHILRTQAHRATRRPLVLLTPKSLLRARPARSKVSELAKGRFFEVLDDPATQDGPGQLARLDPASVRRVILCSGKVAYDAMRRRDELLAAGRREVPAVVRVEQLYPWPEELLRSVLDRYQSATEVVWLQEEPENMGAWSFVHGRLHRLLRHSHQLSHVSRAESPSPATGSHTVHQLETEDLLQRAV